MLFAEIVFGLSLLGIVALFAVKLREMKTQRVLFPEFRERADRQAHVLKDLMLAGRSDLSKLPPILSRLARALVHEIALMMARLAGAMQRQAHRVADLASHKRTFEKRETRSEFLKKVAEHKNAGNGESDTTPL